MSDSTLNTQLDFRALPIAQAGEMLRRVARGLTLGLLDRCMPPLSTLLERGEERLMEAATGKELHRHARSARLGRSWALRRPSPPKLQEIALAWRRNSVTASEGRVRVIERIEQDYQGVTARRVPAQFWQLSGIQAWSKLDFQFELAYIIRSNLSRRVLFAGQEVRELYPAHNDISLLSPQTLWLIVAVAETCPEGFLWQRSQRRLRDAAAQLQQIAEREASTSHWANFWDQWLILEMASQDRAVYGWLPLPLQMAVAALPIFRDFPNYRPALPSESNATEIIDLANWRESMPGWLTRLYHQKAETDSHDEQ